jgi:iron-sulfur cluster repair protein YtfE (RIC family)
MEFVLKRVDPVKKQTLHGLAAIGGLSPMDPPDAYAPPSITPVAVEDMHPFLQRLVAEHLQFQNEVNTFEDTILSIQKDGYTKAADGRLRHFLNFLDEEFIAHNRREEAALFPLLRLRLLAAGEHGSGDEPQTPVDLMQDEHIKAVQLAAVILNFLGLAFRFPDERTRLTILDAALEQGKFLVELLRLHVFREDNVVFPLAQQLITSAEFDRM